MNDIRNIHEDKLMKLGIIALMEAVDNLNIISRDFSYDFRSKNQRYDVLTQLIARSSECSEYILNYHEFPPFSYNIKKVKGKTVVKVVEFRPDLSGIEMIEVEE